MSGPIARLSLAACLVGAGLLALAVLLVAIGDFSDRRCLQWPEAGQCADARTAMALFAAILATALTGVVLLARRPA